MSKLCQELVLAKFLVQRLSLHSGSLVNGNANAKVSASVYTWHKWKHKPKGIWCTHAQIVWSPRPSLYLRLCVHSDVHTRDKCKCKRKKEKFSLRLCLCFHFLHVLVLASVCVQVCSCDYVSGVTGLQPGLSEHTKLRSLINTKNVQYRWEVWKTLCVKKNTILIEERAWVIVGINRFRGMPGLKGLKVAIIGLVNDWSIHEVNLVVSGPSMVCHIRTFRAHF